MYAIALFIAALFALGELRAFLRLGPAVQGVGAALPAFLRPAAGHADPSLRARPVMFAFLLGWALPISFVPLFARSLPLLTAGLRPEFAMALPITAEMLCALVAAILAGALSDRRGWHVPVLAGLLLCFLGALVSAWAPVLEAFIVSRAITGFGYGLAWMGIQGFVVRESRSESRTYSFANLTAGIFTGHLLGTLGGSFLADAVGYRPVFVASGVAVLLPFAFLLLLLRRQPGDRAAAPAVPRANLGVVPARQRIGSLLASRDFVGLLLGSVIPFSITQVGLLYYAVPIFLHAEGFETAHIGTVLSIYSVAVVFLGPAVARIIDRRRDKRLFIVLAGFIGSLSALMLFAAEGAPAMMVSTFLLGIAGSISGPAQSSQALELEAVQSAGPGLATGINRAADKLGQMLGPLVVGGLFSIVGLGPAVALTGALYLLATLAFARSFGQPASETPRLGAAMVEVEQPRA